MSYAELHCISNFTFLRGASHPGELVERAKALGYAALALTDECSLAGIVRAHAAAREAGLPLVVGSEFRLVDGLRFVALATSRGGYAALSRLITRGRRAALAGRSVGVHHHGCLPAAYQNDHRAAGVLYTGRRYRAHG